METFDRLEVERVDKIGDCSAKDSASMEVTMVVKDVISEISCSILCLDTKDANTWTYDIATRTCQCGRRIADSESGDGCQISSWMENGTIMLEHVVSLNVCSQLCLDRNEDFDNNSINTWTFDFWSKACHCGKVVNSKLCTGEIETINDINTRPESWTVTYIAMGRTEPCA